MSFRLAKFELHTARLAGARDRGETRAANRYLAIVRQEARKAIKIRAATRRDLRILAEGREELRRRARKRIADRARETSRPGQPPISHLRGNKGIRLIQYSWDRNARTGVVGYVKFNARGKQVPHTLEHGGQAIVVRRRRGGRVMEQTVRVRARPNIKFRAGQLLPKFAALLEGSFK